ncbi:MAG: 3-isopropylmalate dehydrogenase [Chloroflexi bacterium]|nr:3-isopropylmalate dehydrogenase [Chloroflexota bacterium]
MEAKIAVLPGDGVGPEVMAEAIKVLESVAQRYGHRFHFHSAIVGGAAIDQYGTALSGEAVEICHESDAILFGAVGGPKWDDPKAEVQPEQAIIGLRGAFHLFANLRPIKLLPALANASTLKENVVAGLDIVVVRELTGGLYFGKPKRRWQTRRGRHAVDTMSYSEEEIVRILRVAFELARTRRRKVTSVDKANILATSRLWRELAIEVGREYPDVTLEHLLVDACAMHLLRRPTDFDVIVTENTFGDILTDEAAMLTGSLGMLPSASLGADEQRGGKRFGLYEPIHGTAPDIAGQGIANPVAMILSASFLLGYSLGLRREMGAIEQAVTRVLDRGWRTKDIMEPGKRAVTTSEMGTAIAEAVGEA